MNEPTTVSGSDLVKEATETRTQIKTLQAKLKGIEGQIIARGGGK